MPDPRDTPPDLAPPISLAGTVAAFAVPTAALWLATRLGIPRLRDVLPGPDILCWYLAGGVVFVGLFLAGVVALAVERRRRPGLAIFLRIRLRRPTPVDVVTSLVVLVAGGCCSVAIFGLWSLAHRAAPWLPPPTVDPPFLDEHPWLGGSLTLILAAWLPMFAFNIVGEELWWRGYLLPRQERRQGRWAWLVHAVGLTVFHLPMGLGVTLIAAPFLAGLPWVVQTRRNLWSGVILHALLNGGGFLGIVFSSVGEPTP